MKDPFVPHLLLNSLHICLEAHVSLRCNVVPVSQTSGPWLQPYRVWNAASRHQQIAGRRCPLEQLRQLVSCHCSLAAVYAFPSQRGALPPTGPPQVARTRCIRLLYVLRLWAGDLFWRGLCCGPSCLWRLWGWAAMLSLPGRALPLIGRPLQRPVRRAVVLLAGREVRVILRPPQLLRAAPGSEARRLPRPPDCSALHRPPCPTHNRSASAVSRNSLG